MADVKKLNEEGADYGYLGKVKPIGAGFDATKGVKENLGAIGDAALKGVEGASYLVGGGLLKAGTKAAGLTRIVNNPTVRNALESVVTKQGVSQLKTEGEIFNALSQAIESASPYDKIFLKKQLEKVLEPSVLKKLFTGTAKGVFGATKAGAKLVGLSELLNGAENVKGLFK